MIDKTETEIQAEIREYLELTGWIVYRMNAGRRGAVSLHPKGTPDLLAMKSGVSVFIEVKRPGSKPSPVQMEEHERIEKNGFAVLVADSVETLIAGLSLI